MHFTDETFVSLINGIRPTTLVTNVDNRVPNIINGRKTFLSKLVVEGNVETPTINGINMKSMYNNSLLGNEDIEIFSDLVRIYRMISHALRMLIYNVSNTRIDCSRFLKTMSRLWAISKLPLTWLS